MSFRCMQTCLRFAAFLVAAGFSIAQAEIQVSLQPSVPSPRPLGTLILWEADASDTRPGVLDYRFVIRKPGVGVHMIRDFRIAPAVHWTPGQEEGLYEIDVTVRNRSTGEKALAVEFFTITPRSVGGQPVVTETWHPLMPLYSAAPCPAGASIRVRYTGGGITRYTPWRSCRPGVTSNLFFPGLLPETTYLVNHQVRSGSGTQDGPILPHRTGGLPDWLTTLPDYWILNPADSGSCYIEGIILHSQTGDAPSLVATDIFGRVVWFGPPGLNEEGWLFRPVAGGTLLLSQSDLMIPAPLNKDQIFQEVDLMGNIARETNVYRASEQLIAMGYEPITSFHHDATRLPNGHTIVVASAERILTNVQGPGDVDVIGDMLIDLDENFQVAWAWSSFETMDLSRLAVLGDTCINGQGGCPPVFLAPIANDWTHSNSVHYTPGDGNLIISVRHQDWVIKVDYRDGNGTGELVWRMGKDGDFSITSSDPYPWFSHQHDAEFDIAGVPVMSIYDNGNTRREEFPDAQSRGQTFLVNEPQRRVSPLLNADLGVYALAVGSAERVCNGNYSFDSGIGSAQTLEVLPDGTPSFRMVSSVGAYRTFRMINLFTP